MSEYRSEELQKAVEAVINADTVELKAKHLAKAFSLFSFESRKLHDAYTRLQDRFQQVNHHLQKNESELRQKIVELAAVSNYLEHVLKNITEGILFIDSHGIITTCNETAQNILPAEENLLMKSYFDVFTDALLGFSMKNALYFGVSERIYYVHLPHNKKEIEVSITPVSKGWTGLIIMLRDITKLQKLQIQANKADRMKELGEMAAGVAHEIRNPLGGIRGYASLLLRDVQDTLPLKDMVMKIIEGTKALERIVNNVLHFSRPIDIKPVSQDIRGLISETIELMKVDLSFSDEITFETHLPKQAFHVPYDKHFMQAALINLFVNAMQSYEYEKGNIAVYCTEQNDTCVISITDKGRGIEEEDMEKIFSPFFTTKTSGNGLGLSEVYKIIQAHFGSIDVRSQKGIGSTFTITLPLKR